MDTYLPYRSFMESAGCLDDKTLKRQRIDILQLVESAMRNERLISDPVTKMWGGFEIALCHLGMCCCFHWKERGNADSFYDQFREKLLVLPLRKLYYPPWLGNDGLHNAYRMELLEKNPSWYGRFDWDEKPAIADLTYQEMET